MARKTAHRKGSRKAHRSSRKGSRKQRGGEAPVNYSNPEPMTLSLAQGRQFDAYHANQHGGMAYGPYPGAVTEPSVLPANLVGPAHLLPLNAAFAEIRQFGPDADLKGGRRRRSRKVRKGSRKQKGGDFVRWGGGARKSSKSSKSRKSSRKARKAHRKGSRKAYRGGSYAEMRFPMPVADETKMLIPPQLQEQAGLNPEWKLAENPLSFAPKY
jgi:hypothetical protein